jgi:hypothetical protein
VTGETTQQSRGPKRQAQAPRQGRLASGRSRATAMARRAIRPQRQETRSVRLGTHSDRVRQEAHLADVPTCCDGIADPRCGYSPMQSATAPAAGRRGIECCDPPALLVFAKTDLSSRLDSNANGGESRIKHTQLAVSALRSEVGCGAKPSRNACAKSHERDCDS